jgi:hypothetical protein
MRHKKASLLAVLTAAGIYDIYGTGYLMRQVWKRAHPIIVNDSTALDSVDIPRHDKDQNGITHFTYRFAGKETAGNICHNKHYGFNKQFICVSPEPPLRETVNKVLCEIENHYSTGDVGAKLQFHLVRDDQPADITFIEDFRDLHALNEKTLATAGFAVPVNKGGIAIINFIHPHNAFGINEHGSGLSKSERTSISETAQQIREIITRHEIAHVLGAAHPGETRSKPTPKILARNRQTLENTVMVKNIDPSSSEFAKGGRYGPIDKGFFRRHFGTRDKSPAHNKNNIQSR